MANPRFLGCVLVLLAASACSTPRTGKEVSTVLDHSMDLFLARVEANPPQIGEAYQMYKAIQSVDPAYPGLEETAQALRDDHPDLVEYFSRDWFGSNVAIRMPDDDTTLGTRLMWYLPDRILDIFDIVSFDVHFGLGVYVDAHVTRIVQLNVGARTVAGVGWHNHRSLGILNQADATFGFLALGSRAYSTTQVGTSGIQTGAWGLAGVHKPSEDMYQDFVDYWAVGGSATAAIAGASADVHPLQIYDMLVGWFLFDPLNDDFGHTVGVHMQSQENTYIRMLGEIARSDDEVFGYRQYKDSQSGNEAIRG